MCVNNRESSIDFMSLRFWVGIWVMVLLIIIVAFDLSFLVRYITRFTEESFSILISIIFIYEAFTKIYEIYQHNIVHTGITREDAGLGCYCIPDEFMPMICMNYYILQCRTMHHFLVLYLLNELV